MGRTLTIGDSIIYVDPYGQRCPALVTVVWGAEYHEQHGTQPGCNLVYVSRDGTKEDPYGRQIERNTSVVHLSVQPAHGCYWCWPDEVK